MQTSNQDEAALNAPARQYSIASVELRGALQPEKRGGATLTQVGDGIVYLIGGANREGTSFGDVHRFDIDEREWSLVKPSNGCFPPRSGHSAVAIGAKIYLFGGMDAMQSEIYDDVHIFNTVTSSWSSAVVEGEVPVARNAHAAIALPKNPQSADEGQILVYGGSSPEYGTFNDVFLLHIPDKEQDKPLRWEKITTTGETPEARELHCALLQTNRVICFAGGRNRDGKICTDMALLDLERWSWQIVPMCGWNRCSLTAGVVNGETISFGGFDGGKICGDCCHYNDDEESWLPVDQVEANLDIPERFGHCGTTVTLKATVGQGEKKERQGLLVFGGMNAENDLNDLVLITPSA